MRGERSCDTHNPSSKMADHYPTEIDKLRWPEAGFLLKQKADISNCVRPDVDVLTHLHSEQPKEA